MAVYAAYRHIELDNIGYGKKRVLKPPGGGSSDIFGAPEPVESPRRARNASHLQSSVLGPAVGETPRAAKPGNDSHERLFGAVIPSLAKNKSRSNIPIGEDDLDKGMEVLEPVLQECQPDVDQVVDDVLDDVVDDVEELGEAAMNEAMVRRNPVTGVGLGDRESLRRSARRRAFLPVGQCFQNGNPLTGEGYSLVNGESQPMIAPVVNGVSNGPSSNGPVTNGSSNHATPQRSRVPPGGYSSGLW